MSERFLGLPLVVGGVICLAVDAVWVVVWPVERADGAWSHSAGLADLFVYLGFLAATFVLR